MDKQDKEARLTTILVLSAIILVGFYVALTLTNAYVYASDDSGSEPGIALESRITNCTHKLDETFGGGIKWSDDYSARDVTKCRVCQADFASTDDIKANVLLYNSELAQVKASHKAPSSWFIQVPNPVLLCTGYCPTDREHPSIKGQPITGSQQLCPICGKQYEIVLTAYDVYNIIAMEPWRGDRGETE